MQEDAVRPVRPVVGIERVGGGGELTALVAAPKEGGKVEIVVAGGQAYRLVDGSLVPERTTPA